MKTKKKNEDEEQVMQIIFDNTDGNNQPDDNPTRNVGNKEPTLATFRKDKLKRLCYPRLEAGLSLIKLRAWKYTSSGETHSNNIS